jgi:hypothetical protein
MKKVILMTQTESKHWDPKQKDYNQKKRYRAIPIGDWIIHTLPVFVQSTQPQNEPPLLGLDSSSSQELSSVPGMTP